MHGLFDGLDVPAPPTFDQHFGSKKLLFASPTELTDIPPSLVTGYLSSEGQELAESIIKACQEGRPDHAEADWDRLQGLGSLPPLAEVLPVFIMLARGQTIDALRFMNGMPDDFSPATLALCLRLAGDPTWQGVAQTLQDNPDPLLQDALRILHDMEM